MVEIPIGGGKGFAIVDDEDAPSASAFSWHVTRCGYVQAHSPMVLGRRRTIMLHRLITNAPAGLDVDHINHDKRDCRKANLRLVTHSQNLQNRRGAQITSRTGVRGVSAYETKQGTRYVAFVHVNGRPIRRHAFRTINEARAAAEALRREHHTHSSECD